jgi:hypothetical protein
MESVVEWTREDGHLIEPYGLDISEKLVELPRQRLLPGVTESLSGTRSCGTHRHDS